MQDRDRVQEVKEGGEGRAGDHSPQHRRLHNYALQTHMLMKPGQKRQLSTSDEPSRDKEEVEEEKVVDAIKRVEEGG